MKIFYKTSYFKEYVIPYIAIIRKAIRIEKRRFEKSR